MILNIFTLLRTFYERLYNSNILLSEMGIGIKRQNYQSRHNNKSFCAFHIKPIPKAIPLKARLLLFALKKNITHEVNSRTKRLIRSMIEYVRVNDLA